MKAFLLKTSVVVLALAATLSLSSLHAQPVGTKYGKVSESELTMTEYEKDPGAAAVIIFDVGSTRFEFNSNTGIQVVFERHTRIKIFSKDGYDYANVTIPYYYGVGDNKDDVSAIKGVTFNLEGGKPVETKLEKSDILTEKVTKYQQQVKFALPNVREGSVIEYSYKYITNRIYTLPSWQFRHEIPVIWSEYATAIPDFFNYVQMAQGYDAPEVVKNWDENRTIGDTPFRDRYTQRVQVHLPAFRDEPFSSAEEDVVEKIEYQLSTVNFPGMMTEKIIPTWGQLAKGLSDDEDFGKFLKKGSQVKDAVALAINGLSSDKDKIAAIHQHIKDNYQWNEYYGIWTSQPIANLLKTRQGNGADLNLLLVLMLREAGIDANPVILSTRSHGKINSLYPILYKFNHVVAYIKSGDKGYALDAIDPMLPSDMVAYEDLNGEGLLVGEEHYGWVALGDNVKETSYHSIVATLEDGVLKGTISMAHRGYGATEIRKKFKKSNNSDIATAYFKNYFTEVNLKDPAFENQADANASLKGNVQFTSNAYVEDGGTFIYVSPMLGFGMKENPFKKPERNYPIDFAHPTEDTYLFTFKVPAGYTVTEAPKPVRLSLEDGSMRCDYNIETKPNEVKVSYRFSRKRIQFKVEEYQVLRNFYEQLATQCGGQIVLKKNDE
ncbi:MAG: transglutaminase domain-containing protein [Saprospiraceae bacterium]